MLPVDMRCKGFHGVKRPLCALSTVHTIAPVLGGEASINVRNRAVTEHPHGPNKLCRVVHKLRLHDSVATGLRQILRMARHRVGAILCPGAWDHRKVMLLMPLD